MKKEITEDALKIMQLIEEDANISQRVIAKNLGLSLGKTNYCISSLIEIGYIKIKNFTNSNKKINYLYLLTPKGIKEKSTITKNFIAKKKEEYDILVKYIDE
jgi:EPS-associated MarR family transcriptional regulator